MGFDMWSSGKATERKGARRDGPVRLAAASLGGSLVVSALLALAPPVALAEDSMRCGTRLVSSGDGKDKVRTLCGEPTSVSFVGLRSAPRDYYYRGPYGDAYAWPGWLEVPVEVWTYNFGSSKLLRRLRFVGDELDEIWTDGYGY